MPRARSRGTNGAFAALNTNATSGRRRVIEWATDSAVWLSVSAALNLSAGKWTRCISAYSRRDASALRQYTVT
jgi:hypothetical protein